MFSAPLQAGYTPLHSQYNNNTAVPKKTFSRSRTPDFIIFFRYFEGRNKKSSVLLNKELQKKVFYTTDTLCPFSYRRMSTTCSAMSGT